MLRAYQSCTSGSGSTPRGRTCYHARHARGASILSMMLVMLDERARRATSISFVYRKLEHDSLMDRVQLILSLDLLLRLLSCKPLLPSDCLHCLKTPTDLSDSITLSDTFVGSTSVTAKELKIRVIRTTKKILGKKHLDTLTNIVNLASTYQNQDR